MYALVYKRPSKSVSFLGFYQFYPGFTTSGNNEQSCRKITCFYEYDYRRDALEVVGYVDANWKM